MENSFIHAVNIENLDVSQIYDFLMYIGSLKIKVNAPISIKDVENRKENNVCYLVFIEDENLLMFYTQSQLDEIKTEGNFTLMMRDNKLHIFQAIVNKNMPSIANLYYTVDRSQKNFVFAHVYIAHENKVLCLFPSVSIEDGIPAKILEQIKDYVSQEKNIIYCLDKYGFSPLRCNIASLN